MEKVLLAMECQGCGEQYTASVHAARLVRDGHKGYCAKTQQYAVQQFGESDSRYIDAHFHG